MKIWVKLDLSNDGTVYVKKRAMQPFEQPDDLIFAWNGIKGSVAI